MLSSNRWPIPSTKRTSWGLWIAWTRGTSRREMAWTQSIYVNLRQIHLLHLFWHVFPHLWCGVVLATSTSQKVSTGQNLKPKNPPWVAKRQLCVEKRFFFFVFRCGIFGEKGEVPEFAIHAMRSWDHWLSPWEAELTWGAIPALGWIAGGSRDSPTDGHRRQSASCGSDVAKPPHQWFGPKLPIPKARSDEPDLRTLFRQGMW